MLFAPKEAVMRRLWWLFWLWSSSLSASSGGWAAHLSGEARFRRRSSRPMAPSCCARPTLPPDRTLQALGADGVGSVWGHGSLRRSRLDGRLAAPRVPLGPRPLEPRDSRHGLRRPGSEVQAPLRQRLIDRWRRNTHDPATGRVVIDPARAWPRLPGGPLRRRLRRWPQRSTPSRQAPWPTR